MGAYGLQSKEAVDWLKNCGQLNDYELESLTADETRPRITPTMNGHMLFYVESI